jgi:serine/threonine protein kinase
MEDYEMITRLGGGSFADVYKAREKSTGELVAIKILKKKYKKWEECIELRECKCLQILNKTLSHEKGKENIIKLKRIIFINKTGVLNLVFEYMEKDLFFLMKSYEPQHLPESKIKDIIYQTLLGLAYMHKYGFFHRDLKPENLLLMNNEIKIADFGLAREIRSIPPYTEYVSTRYYRAPECLLKSTNYNSPIDIWALGCVMAEMYLHPQPLFYGANEKEVLFRICSVLGPPTYDVWPDGVQLANHIGFKFPNINNNGCNNNGNGINNNCNNGNTIDLKKIICNASEEAIDLMKLMLKWDPNQRETASNLLKHKFF